MRANIIKYTLLLWALFLTFLPSFAEDYPSVAPSVTFTTADGETSTDPSFSGSAPVKASFMANPSNTDGWDAYYEWRIYHDADTIPYIIRYEQDTELEFTQSGSHRIVLYAKFTKGNDVQEFLTDDDPITVSISESQLQMPNAFTPNGDGVNDVFRVKEGYTSIIQFHAAVFSRWGKKLYEWDDPAGGWDGRSGGKDVPDGGYYLNIEARGADGKKYHIRKVINVLRGYTESGSTGTN